MADNLLILKVDLNLFGFYCKSLCWLGERRQPFLWILVMVTIQDGQQHTECEDWPILSSIWFLLHYVDSVSDGSHFCELWSWLPFKIADKRIANQRLSPNVPSTQKKKKFELFWVFPVFEDFRGSFHLALVQSPLAWNNIFHFAGKNSQNIRGRSPFPSIRVTCKLAKATGYWYPPRILSKAEHTGDKTEKIKHCTIYFCNSC